MLTRWTNLRVNLTIEDICACWNVHKRITYLCHISIKRGFKFWNGFKRLGAQTSCHVTLGWITWLLDACNMFVLVVCSLFIQDNMKNLHQTLYQLLCFQVSRRMSSQDNKLLLSTKMWNQNSTFTLYNFLEVVCNTWNGKLAIDLPFDLVFLFYYTSSILNILSYLGPH